jgi:hypothetical protein
MILKRRIFFVSSAGASSFGFPRYVGLNLLHGTLTGVALFFCSSICPGTRKSNS